MCLWIAAITLAVSVGANLFQAIVIDPVWSGLPPDSVRAFAGSPYVARLYLFHTSPLLFVGLLALVASPFLAWNRPEMRVWLLVSLACYAAVAIWTALYFWPLNRLLLVPGNAGADAATITAAAYHWIFADRFRYLLRLASFVCVLRAMVLSGRSS